MGNLTKNYPFALILGTIGFLIGILPIMTMSLSSELKTESSTGPFSNPLGGYMLNSLKIIGNSILLGVGLGILFGLGGLAIDIFKTNRKIENNALVEKYTQNPV
ncbi:hypothetical protein K0A97_02185 [Patescibacteria group bacterium]|nr:hypothetical protein [Patescibacteria group bacterium]